MPALINRSIQGGLVGCSPVASFRALAGLGLEASSSAGRLRELAAGSCFVMLVVSCEDASTFDVLAAAPFEFADARLALGGMSVVVRWWLESARMSVYRALNSWHRVS